METHVPPENVIVPLAEGVIGGQAVQTVNARDLHAFLENGDRFADWIKARIEKFDFVENQDFVTVSESTETVKNGKTYKSRRADYHVCLDMAKELAMVENNDKGKQARRHFIAVEKRAKVPPYVNPPLPAENLAALRTLREAGTGLSRNRKLDLIDRYVPSVTVGAHRVPALPGLPPPDEQTAGVVERLRAKGVPVLEQAEGFRRLQDLGYRASEIADMVTLHLRTVQLRLQLLDGLSPRAKQALTEDRLTAQQARHLCGHPWPVQDRAVANILADAPGWGKAATLPGLLAGLAGPGASRLLTPPVPPALDPPAAPPRRIAKARPAVAADGAACLRWLLDWRIDDASVGELIFAAKVSPGADGALAPMGLRVDVDGWDGFLVVADMHPMLMTIFAKSPWETGWRLALLSLAGARPTKVLRFRRVATTAVAVPVRMDTQVGP